jgi:hypothetical protein
LGKASIKDRGIAGSIQNLSDFLGRSLTVAVEIIQHFTTIRWFKLRRSSAKEDRRLRPRGKLIISYSKSGSSPGSA